VSEPGDLHDLFDDHFRHRHGRLTASLLRRFGPGSLELVEDALQEAMARALRHWPYAGVPDEPTAWLGRVAHNLVIDGMRREAPSLPGEIALAEGEALARTDQEPDELSDDRLRLIFTCCHPALSPSSRVALTLKCVCGFGVAEIAGALLCGEDAIARRLSRAKATLRVEAAEFEIPAGGELRARMDSVLDVLYLVFNEGYSAHAGEEMIRQDLVEEALRLCGILLRSEETAEPRTHALAALMLFVGARNPARLSPSGELTVLASQDRRLWRRDWLALAWQHFQASMDGDRLSPFHVEAAIASCHAAAAHYAATDWAQILEHYDQLVAMTSSPLARLNRSVALFKVKGAKAALADLDAVENQSALRNAHLLPATRGLFHWSRGETPLAVSCFEDALAHARGSSRAERELLERYLSACRQGRAAPAI
jgi:RNA polymerase sigma factor (sigma-70 family)